MNEVEEWVKLAEAKGWRTTLTADRMRVRFLPPDGGLVVCSLFPKTASAVANQRSQLRRAGLEIPHAGAKKAMKDTPITTVEVMPPTKLAVTPSRADTLETTLAHALELIEVLAEEVQALRQQQMDKRETVPAAPVEHDHPDMATAAQLAELHREVQQAIAEIARRVDPVGAFRARLRGEETKATCPDCGKSFDSRPSLRGHQIKVHSGK